jgi:hypothetical protein
MILRHSVSLVLRALICFMALGAVGILGCSSDPAADDKAKEATKAAIATENKELAESVKGNPRAKGTAPRSIKGGGVPGAPGD